MGLPCWASRNGSNSSTGCGNDVLSSSSAAGLVGVKAVRWAVSSRKRKTAVEKPPSSRLALLAIASNTGVVSDGELAITFRMSDVAVCRSSASCVSLNSRVFSIAITAWSAKVCSSPICCVANEPRGSARLNADGADRLTPRVSSGIDQHGCAPRSPRSSAGTARGTLSSSWRSARTLGLRASITLPTIGVARMRRAGTYVVRMSSTWHGQSACPPTSVDQLAVEAIDACRSSRRIAGSARSTMASNTGCTSERRTGDHLQDVGRGGLRAPAPPCTSLNSPTFSIAITAWSANICSRRVCCSPNGPGAARVTVMMPTASPSFISGANSMLR